MARTVTPGRSMVSAPVSDRAGLAAAIPDFKSMPRPALAALVEAGEEVLDCYRVLAKTGDNIVGEILRGERTFYEWTHYPDGDVYDFESHAQYYYHAHPKHVRPNEHGHFHTFLRPRGMPKGVLPLPALGHAAPAQPDDALSHLVAVSMNDKGYATQLFTTNRWVTGETWYAARDVIAMLDRFAIDLVRPSWVVNRWLTALLRLFRPQIEALLVERDRVVGEWRRLYPRSDVFEDRALEVASQLEISIEDQMRSALAALKRSRR